MERALTWRRRAFLVAGIPCLLLVLSVDTIAGIFEEEPNPDALTVGAWLFMATDTVVLSKWLFGESQLRKMYERLMGRKRSVSVEDIGKTLSFLAASLVSTPVVMGLVILSISGDAWRLYIFVPISLLGGIYLWRRIEDALRQWEQFSAVSRGIVARGGAPPDEILLKSPWLFGITTTVALIFLASNLGDTGTGQETTALETIGFALLMILAISSVWSLPRLTGRAPHRLLIFRCVIAIIPYLVALVATRFGAPQWPPGATLLVFVSLLIVAIRTGRKSLAAVDPVDRSWEEETCRLRQIFPGTCPIGPYLLGFIDEGANEFLGAPWQDFFATCEVFDRA